MYNFNMIHFQALLPSSACDDVQPTGDERLQAQQLASQEDDDTS